MSPCMHVLIVSSGWLSVAAIMPAPAAPAKSAVERPTRRVPEAARRPAAEARQLRQAVHQMARSGEQRDGVAVANKASIGELAALLDQ